MIFSERHKDKCYLVTGASRGIGAKIAELLAAEGARVAITYSSSSAKAEGVLESLRGDSHRMVQMNLQNPESVKDAFKSVLDDFPQLDGLVNNAGITKDQILLRMKDEEFDDVINTNLKGAYLCTKLAMKPMMKKRYGSIVNVTSVIGQMGNAGQSNYAASKAGIEGFTKSIAREVASRNIRLNCVAPGLIQTDMTGQLSEDQKQQMLNEIPLARWGTPEDVARAVSFLLSDEASYVTGQTLSVNGGMYM